MNKENVLNACVLTLVFLPCSNTRMHSLPCKSNESPLIQLASAAFWL